jgi:tRNA(Ile)-lysidine synthase
VPEDPFLHALAAKISEWPREHDEIARFAVAFSGGLDSAVLLTALCRLGMRDSVRALHVDHGLHPESARWEAHCRKVAQESAVRYQSLAVEVDIKSGLGLEAAARKARYRALAQALAPGEILLTAHHADDQLETVLLRLLRGSGVRGLRGIIEFARLGPGYLGRPLLGFAKTQLQTQAQRWQLRWLDDPANTNLAHDRNFLRRAVVPTLAQRWPAAPRMAQRLTQQMADADELLESMAAHDARNVRFPERLPRAQLTPLVPSRQRNLLRYLIRRAGLSTPSAAQLEGLRASLLTSRPDAQTQIRWPGGEGRIYRECLYLLKPLPAGSVHGYRTELRVQGWSGPEGRISFEPVDGPGLPQSWLEAGVSLGFRAGGERFQPQGRAHSWSLKHWLQHEGVLPWMRGRIPLLFRGDRLVAVADLAVDDTVRTAPAEPRWRVSWTEHPPVR